MVSPVPDQVLLIDSGLGGLSIYRESRRYLSGLNCTYILDNAYFPYGKLDPDTLRNRLHALIERAHRCMPIRVLVLACNTATVSSIQQLRQNYNFPIIGVEPGLKPALKLASQHETIGLVATEGTLASHYMQERIAKLSAIRRIVTLNGQALVPLAEGLLLKKLPTPRALRKIFQPWLDNPPFPTIVVLGCTHFPLLAGALQAILPRGIKLLDNSAAVASRIKSCLDKTVSKTVDTAFNASGKHCAVLTKKSVDEEAIQALLEKEGFVELNYFL